MVRNGSVLRLLLGMWYIPFTSDLIHAMEKSCWKECHTQRLLQVDGDNGKKNDIIFCGQLMPAATNVIFFSGDVQDYKEKMLAHRDNRLYAEWDLESSAAIISNRFPSSHVWTVKAAQMIVGTFNIFSNFVKWTDVPSGGIGPVHQPGQRSWHHLRSLLQNSVMRMNAACDQAISRHSVQNAACYGETFNANLPIVLVGFSKGCVVLNQLAYDLASLSGDEDTDVENFVNLVESVYWLDGGHGGGAETWVTRDDVLAYLTRFEIHSRVTPYQVNDFLRPWIGREHEAFVAGLQRHKAKVDDILLFGDQPRSLENHFRILRLF